MRAEDMSVSVRLEATNLASKEVKKLGSDLEKMSKSVKTSGSQVSSFFSNIKSSALGALGAVAGFETTKGLLKLVGTAEQAQMSFETLLGSAEKAKQMMNDISAFSAKTPFESANLTPLVQQLIGMGFEAKNALPTIQVLGDSMSALGRSQADLDGVVLALGQIQTKGKVSAEELMQMAERGLPVFSILEQKLNLTKKQLGDIGNAGISSATGINALLTGLNEKFAGSMEKQNKTMFGQWSNLMDNMKSLFTKSGEGIGREVTNLLTKINAFYEKHKPAIVSFTTAFFTEFLNAFRSVAMVLGVFGSAFNDVLVSLGQGTDKSVQSQGSAWQWLVMVMSAGVQTIALIVNTVVRGAFTGLKTFINVVKMISSGAFSTVITMVGMVGKTIENIINGAIGAFNKFLSFIGQAPIQASVKFADDMIKQGVEGLKATYSQGAEDISGDWDKAFGEMSTDFSQYTSRITQSVNTYKSGASGAIQATSDLDSRIQQAIGNMNNLGKGAGGMGGAGGGKGAKGKSSLEEFKELQKKAEETLKPIINLIEDEQKAVADSKEEIKKKTQEWQNYKKEGVKALSDVLNEIRKTKQEASDIQIKFTGDRNSKLAERAVEIDKEILDKKSEILKIQKETTSDAEQFNENQAKVSELQSLITALEKERQYATSNTTSQAVEQAKKYNEMSESQRIVTDLESERSKALAENAKKMEVLEEKRKILDLQAHQESMNQLKIKTSTIDGVISAQIETEKGKYMEIKDYENIILAQQIADKQVAMVQEMDALNSQLMKKQQAEKMHLEQLKDLYTKHNQYLSSDTKKTADEMTASLAGVAQSLRQVIQLRREAGMETNMAVGLPTIAGARANGGPVSSGRTYLVGERGPELFTPSLSGNIISNGDMGGSGAVSINIGEVHVHNEADENRLVDKIKDMLTRERQLTSYGF